MEDALRIYRTISIALACLVVFVVGMSMDLSLKHAREQLESVTSLLTPPPWSPHIWRR
jgi:hypothetical protein